MTGSKTTGSGNDIATKPEGWKISLTEDQIKWLVSDHVKTAVQQEIATDKATLFTVFGIFASIVTFVSVEIQILKSICSIWNILGFSLVILASLLLFLLMLDYIWRWWRNSFKDEVNKFPWIILILIVIIFIVSIYAMSIGSEQQCKENAIYNKYQEEFQDKQIDLEKNLKKSQVEFEKKMLWEIKNQIDSKLNLSWSNK